MAYQKIQKSASWTPKIQKKTPSLAPPPIVVQRAEVSGDTEVPMPEYKPLPPDYKVEDHPLMRQFKRRTQNGGEEKPMPQPQEQFQQQPATETPSASGGYRAIQAKGEMTGDRPKSTESAGEGRSNKTGLPDALKTGIENLSGYSMDDVRVHYNSEKPAQLQALAYTQGTDIHVAAGQEQHLPHEAWHVVQQKQGRVKPTTAVGDMAVNDNPSLENEATKMGEAALQCKSVTDNKVKEAAPGLIHLALQRETNSEKTSQELLSIVRQLEQLENEAKSLENEEYPAPGLRQLTEKITKLKKIATGKDDQQKSQALQGLKSEIPNGNISAIKASSAASSKQSSPEQTPDKSKTISQKQSSNPIQGFTKFEIGSIVGGVVVGIGLIAGGIYHYVQQRRARAIFEEFGNTHRNADFNPDIIGPGGINQVIGQANGARPEDVPAIGYFRTRFHQLHSAKLYMESKHPGLIEGFEKDRAADLNDLSLKDRLIEISANVKNESKEHKKRVKNILTDTDIAGINKEYTQNIQVFGDQALSLANLIVTYINDNSQDNRNLNDIHRAGTDLWRETWHRAIMAVNTVLHGRWPHWKGEIRNWISDKRDKDLINYMDPNQVIGLDYIGSLAKGYKGPPKQAVRFMPEKFDVDANLTAPPLAAYAIAVGGAMVDRGRIWSRAAGSALYDGLLQLMENDIQERLEAAGLIEMGMDPKEPFEVAIDAEGIENLPNVPVAVNQSKALSERDRQIRDKLYWLRHNDPARFSRVANRLNTEKFTGLSPSKIGSAQQLFLTEHDEENQTYAFTDLQLTEIDNIIDNTP